MCAPKDQQPLRRGEVVDPDGHLGRLKWALGRRLELCQPVTFPFRENVTVEPQIADMAAIEATEKDKQQLVAQSPGMGTPNVSATALGAAPDHARHPD